MNREQGVERAARDGGTEASRVTGEGKEGRGSGGAMRKDQRRGWAGKEYRSCGNKVLRDHQRRRATC
eukprot:scaffold148651_cov31-Tisochrysis_lutea.AAC.16